MSSLTPTQLLQHQRQQRKRDRLEKERVRRAAQAQALALSASHSGVNTDIDMSVHDNDNAAADDDTESSLRPSDKTSKISTSGLIPAAVSKRVSGQLKKLARRSMATMAHRERERGPTNNLGPAGESQSRGGGGGGGLTLKDPSRSNSEIEADAQGEAALKQTESSSSSSAVWKGDSFGGMNDNDVDPLDLDLTDDNISSVSVSAISEHQEQSGEKNEQNEQNERTEEVRFNHAYTENSTRLQASAPCVISPFKENKTRERKLPSFLSSKLSSSSSSKISLNAHQDESGEGRSRECFTPTKPTKPTGSPCKPKRKLPDFILSRHQSQIRANISTDSEMDIDTDIKRKEAVEGEVKASVAVDAAGTVGLGTAVRQVTAVMSPSSGRSVSDQHPRFTLKKKRSPLSEPPQPPPPPRVAQAPPAVSSIEPPQSSGEGDGEILRSERARVPEVTAEVTADLDLVVENEASSSSHHHSVSSAITAINTIAVDKEEAEPVARKKSKKKHKKHKKNKDRTKDTISNKSHKKSSSSSSSSKSSKKQKKRKREREQEDVAKGQTVIVGQREEELDLEREREVRRGREHQDKKSRTTSSSVVVSASSHETAESVDSASREKKEKKKIKTKKEKKRGNWNRINMAIFNVLAKQKQQQQQDQSRVEVETELNERQKDAQEDTQEDVREQPQQGQGMNGNANVHMSSCEAAVEDHDQYEESVQELQADSSFMSKMSKMLSVEESKSHVNKPYDYSLHPTPAPSQAPSQVPPTLPVYVYNPTSTAEEEKKERFEDDMEGVISDPEEESEGLGLYANPIIMEEEESVDEVMYFAAPAPSSGSVVSPAPPLQPVQSNQIEQSQPLESEEKLECVSLVQSDDDVSGDVDEKEEVMASSPLSEGPLFLLLLLCFITSHHIECPTYPHIHILTPLHSFHVFCFTSSFYFLSVYYTCLIKSNPHLSRLYIYVSKCLSSACGFDSQSSGSYASALPGPACPYQC